MAPTDGRTTNISWAGQKAVQQGNIPIIVYCITLLVKEEKMAA